MKQEAIHGDRARNSLIKPILNLFVGEYNGKLFRRSINDMMIKSKTDKKLPVGEIIMQASQCLSERSLLL